MHFLEQLWNGLFLYFKYLSCHCVVLDNFPRFSTTMSLDNDYPLAKMCVGILHAIHREISDCVLRQRLTHEGIVNYV